MSHRSDDLELALETAREAGLLALSHLRRRSFTVRAKGDGSPVTEADEEIDALVRRRLLEARPDDGYLGEESGELSGVSGRRWIVDPIDGTKSFARRVPLFGTLIALESEGLITAGVVHLPALAETLYAEAGGGAWLISETLTGRSPVRVSVSQTQEPNDALLCSTPRSGYRRADVPAAFDALLATFGHYRGWSDCYAHLLVATGRADVAVAPLLRAWDCAPFLSILPEAGGVASTMNGTVSVEGGSLVTANSTLHQCALDALRPLCRPSPSGG